MNTEQIKIEPSEQIKKLLPNRKTIYQVEATTYQDGQLMEDITVFTTEIQALAESVCGQLEELAPDFNGSIDGRITIYTVNERDVINIYQPIEIAQTIHDSLFPEPEELN